MKPGRRLRPGAWCTFGNGELEGEVLEELPTGGRLVRFVWQGTFEETLHKLGGDAASALHQGDA